MTELEYEKRIAEYRASTDAEALRWRAAVLAMDEKSQKKSFYRFAVADARMSEATHSIVGIATEGWPIMMQGNHTAQTEFRTRIDGTSAISTVVPDTSRRWMLVTSARIEKTKTGKHL